MDYEQRAKHFGRSEVTAWIIATYASFENRQELINRYNTVVGPPSEFIKHVHDDFLKNRMADDEVIAFVIICEELIFAANNIIRNDLSYSIV